MLIDNSVPFPSLIRILLTFVSIFSLYSVHLLLKTANEGGMLTFLRLLKRFMPVKIFFLLSCFCVLHITGSLLYEQLGHKAFGLVGKLAASGSITMQNIGGKNFLKGDLGRLFALCVAQSGDTLLLVSHATFCTCNGIILFSSSYVKLPLHSEI